MKMILLLAATFAVAYGFDSQSHETVRQTFPASARLDVENVNGRIHVAGYSGSQIQMVAEKNIRADSDGRLEAAKREVSLDIRQSGDTLTLCVIGPFRPGCGDGDRSVHEDGHHGYTVTYDFELQVPRATLLHLATINHGAILVENTTGDFELRNVNAGIEMREVTGSGSARSVNGKIEATFTSNPGKECSFKTVNGNIETSFPPTLSADVRLKTFNGGAYSDFDGTALPRIAPAAEQQGSKRIYRTDHYTSLRIGNGGPTLNYDTLNGNIRILKKGQ